MSSKTGASRQLAESEFAESEFEKVQRKVC